MSRSLAVALTALLTLALVACSSGGGGREVQIVAHADGCTPASISAQSGEALTLVVKNEAGGDRELEGVDGTKVEEVLVPDGRTRRIDFTMPSDHTVQKVKCYIPGGPSTIIELSPTAGARRSSDDADTTVHVDLTEWTVTPDVSAVHAGNILFVAHNRSKAMTHELAVLSVGADAQRREVADVEGLKPGEEGQFLVDLAPGSYELACLIVPGEAGSQVDHYQLGMHTPFTVQ
jgi:uncharacterized cupredoxin-like copper-binding protein